MRKEKVITINDRGNELTFKIKEMPALQLESWLIRAGLLLVGSGAFDSAEVTDAGDALNTFIKTDFKVFRMQITNPDKCKKYADIPCEFKMEEDTMFDENKDYIIAYNDWHSHSCRYLCLVKFS